MNKTIEILPYYPDGFLVVFSDTSKGARKEADRIQKAVMVDLLMRGYLPKQTEIEWKDKAYYFQVVVKKARPELLEDLKLALSNARG